MEKRKIGRTEDQKHQFIVKFRINWTLSNSLNTYDRHSDWHKLEVYATNNKLEVYATNNKLEVYATNNKLEVCATNNKLEVCATNNRLETQTKSLCYECVYLFLGFTIILKHG